jgi:hypothetical protein
VDDEIEFTPDPMLGPRIWANWTRVILGKEEVTIDFAVIDPLDSEQGSLVARIVLTAGASYDLRDLLVEEMRRYTERGRPPLE